MQKNPYMIADTITYLQSMPIHHSQTPWYFHTYTQPLILFQFYKFVVNHFKSYTSACCTSLAHSCRATCKQNRRTVHSATPLWSIREGITMTRLVILSTAIDNWKAGHSMNGISYSYFKSGWPHVTGSFWSRTVYLIWIMFPLLNASHYSITLIKVFADTTWDSSYILILH